MAEIEVVEWTAGCLLCNWRIGGVSLTKGEAEKKGRQATLHHLADKHEQTKFREVVVLHE